MLAVQQEPAIEAQAEAAPIVIGEEDPMPREEAVQAQPATIDMPVMQGGANGCPIVMPYCQDDGEEPITPPIMPNADGGEAKPFRVNEKKADASSEDSENTDFTEWRKLFEGETKKEKSPTAEELPAPTEEEEPQAEPKCQEDSHLHEHYPGCPRRDVSLHGQELSGLRAGEKARFGRKQRGTAARQKAASR